jgi:hypothetical protein
MKDPFNILMHMDKTVIFDAKKPPRVPLVKQKLLTHVVVLNTSQYKG